MRPMPHNEENFLSKCLGFKTMCEYCNSNLAHTEYDGKGKDDFTFEAGSWSIETLYIKNLQCHICGKILSRRQTLKIHMQTHLNYRNIFACNLCSAEFMWKESLNRHMKLKH